MWRMSSSCGEDNFRTLNCLSESFFHESNSAFLDLTVGRNWAIVELVYSNPYLLQIHHHRLKYQFHVNCSFDSAQQMFEISREVLASRSKTSEHLMLYIQSAIKSDSPPFPQCMTATVHFFLTYFHFCVIRVIYSRDLRNKSCYKRRPYGKKMPLLPLINEIISWLIKLRFAPSV